MSSFIVMQGETYQEEKRDGLIWSPQRDKSGMVPPSYQRMQEVKKGDRIFHYVRGLIVAVSVAKEDCRKGSKPHRTEEGFLVPADYYELDEPLSVRAYIEELKPVLPVKYSAFQEDGTGNPGYLYPCNEELTIRLMEGISRGNIHMPEAEQLELAIEVVRKVEHYPLITLIAETVLSAKMKIERGERAFSEQLLPHWNGKCAVCGIDEKAVLKASRSKPWKDSTERERKDLYNGVVLCAIHDAMYRAGLISFNANGRLYVAERIPEEQYGLYGLAKGKKIPVEPDNEPYFRWHKRYVFVDKRKIRLKNKPD